VLGLNTLVACGLFQSIKNGSLVKQIKKSIAPFVTTHFVIDQDRMTISHDIPGEFWQSSDISRDFIEGICFTPRYLSYCWESESNGKIETVVASTRAVLKILVNYQEMSIPGTARLNESELKWLAQELANFLEKPIRTKPVAHITPLP
jgi:hypothetical protein